MNTDNFARHATPSATLEQPLRTCREILERFCTFSRLERGLRVLFVLGRNRRLLSPVAQLGGLGEFLFRLLKAKVGLPASPLQPQGGYDIDRPPRSRNTRFLHLDKSTIFLVFKSAFWRHPSARPTLQKSTNESRRCLPPVVRRLLWAKVGAKCSPRHTLHRRSAPQSQEIVIRLVKYSYFYIGRATFH